MSTALNSNHDLEVEGKTILVIDDHPDIRELLTLQLKFLGLKAIPASSGQKALAMLKDFRPDLILLDLWMPHMDGFELLRLVKNDAERRDIPILAITGMYGPKVRARCLAVGCDAYLTKPFRWEELRHQLSILVSRSRPAGVRTHSERRTQADRFSWKNSV